MSDHIGHINALERRIKELERRVSKEYQRGFEDATAGSTPVYLTKGSFGKVSSLSLSSSVYKTTHTGDTANAQKLQHEFSM